MNKLQLRKQLLLLRDGFDGVYKRSADAEISKLLFLSDDYVNADEVFVYVSVRSEVDTSAIIKKAFFDGKKVAVPFCENGFMRFYYINSADDLCKSQFGVPTVDISKSIVAEHCENTLCIVPALSFDYCRNRIGYGGGYYDRFLADAKLKTVGLCREKSMSVILPTDKYDVKVDKVITEKNVY